MMSVKRLISLLVTAAFLAQGCTSGGSGKTQQEGEKKAETPGVAAAAPVEVNAEALLLINELEQTGDYVNSREFPSLIKASVVHDEAGAGNHIIDLRPVAEYARGHIQGAVSVAFEALPEYLESKIKPFEFDKVILVCASGQVSSYAASLLRIMGYGNVYALRWGMSSWNRALAEEYWLKGISAAYESRLETSDQPAATPGDLPQLNTGLTTGGEILDRRFRQLMSEGSQVAQITAAEVFADPGKYYIINFERKDKYESGHIPGAVRYKPAGTLGILPEMETIPHDKPVVVYCGTGHNSAFATAYLRLFGWDAKTLVYGNNAFMHDKMINDRASLSWLPFTQEEIHDYPLAK